MVLLLCCFAVALFAVSSYRLLHRQQMEQAAAGLDQTSILHSWFGATTVFALFFMAMTFVAVRSLRRWFDQHVDRPLKSLAVLVPDSAHALGENPVPPTQWKETAKIAALIQDFIGRLNDHDIRAQRLEQDAANRLRECEAGFHRELRRAREKATTDPLTRLRNRTFLDSEGANISNGHNDLGRPLAAIMMDLDNFKLYNDTHGHQVGDALLRFVGGLLRGSIRPGDHAIRYGGDEFLLLMPGASACEAQAIGERLIKLFAQYTACLEESKGLSLSAGVAAFPDFGCQDVWQLIACADRALYLAKSRGKNVVVLATAEPPEPAAATAQPRLPLFNRIRPVEAI